MVIEVEARNSRQTRANVRIDRHPDECPQCHNRVIPVPLLYRSLDDKFQNSLLEGVYHCPASSCNRVFIAEFHPRFSSMGTVHYFESSAPNSPRAVNLPEDVRKISASFAKIYGQALRAEEVGLDELAGIGLRKALEFLVKDLAIHRHPAEAEKIKAKGLAACIADYVDDARVRDAMRLASWLGNDETHYYRKFNDKDIGDLRMLMELVIAFAHQLLALERYKAAMNPPKPPNK